MSGTPVVHLLAPLLLLLPLLLVASPGMMVDAGPVAGVRFAPALEYQQTYLVLNITKQYLGVPPVFLIPSIREHVTAFVSSGFAINLFLDDPGSTYNLSLSKDAAVSWLKTWLPDNPSKTLNITTITFGRDLVFASPKIIKRVLDSMANIRAACADLGLKGVPVTTVFSFDVFTTAFPPSEADFQDDVATNVRRILYALNATGAPLQVELMPFDLSTSGALKGVDIKYGLIAVDPTGDLAMVDPSTRARYGNVFDMMLDSVYSALDKAGFGDLPVEVASTGWPCSLIQVGFAPPGVSSLSAGEYVGRLLTMLNTRNGTPMRPDGPGPLAVYLETLLDGTSVVEGFYYGIIGWNGMLRYPVEWDGNYNRFRDR